MAETNKEKRRSRRYLVRIPATMRGVDAMGRGYFLQAEVISLDTHGARVHWRYPVNLAQNVEIRLINENDTKLFRVIRPGESGSPEEMQAGLEFVDAKESWNLEELVAKWGLESF